MNNRLLTPPKQIVDSTGSVVSSKQELVVTFEKQTRMIMDRVKRRCAPVEFTNIVCDGRTCAWMMSIPMPPNVVSPPDLVVWGYFCPAGEITLQSGVPRDKAEESARQFAVAMVLNEVEEKAAG